MPKISIVIVSYNTSKITLETIESVFNSLTKYDFEVILVDNASKDNTVTEAKRIFSDIKIIENEVNLGFSKANNLGINSSSGEYVLLLNSDTILYNDTLELLMDEAILKGYEICGPQLLNKDLTVQRSWFNFPSTIKIFLRLTDIYLLFYKLSKTYLFKLVFTFRKPAFMISNLKDNTKVDYLSFACILIKRDLLNGLGLLDEELFFYHEDCEYGLRCSKNNHEIYYCTKPKLIHLGGCSSINSSLIAMKNDVKGLLHIYKKHYNQISIQKIKYSIRFALKWRIFFWHFGFYKYAKKIGLYQNPTNKKTEIIPLQAYRDIIKLTY